MRFSKIKLTAKRATFAQNSMTHRSKWRLGGLASAIALLCSLSHNPSLALGLGKVTVQSALGEALRAEVDVPEITADEAASLRVSVASPAAFKAAGLEYSPTVGDLQITLQKRADGRSFLRLSSSRPVAEPFVDLILEANWASGRLLRDYTMLFDPPNLRQANAGTTTAPSLAKPLASSIAAAPLEQPARSQVPPAARPAVQATPVARETRPPAVKEKVPAQAKPAMTGQQVTVKVGDTASKIAAQNKPASISLDQMLVALLKSNPDAFASGNINRLRAGAVLEIPSEQDAAAVSSADASRTIVAQAKDFNEFRQKLASGAPMTQVESANRQSAGKVQAKVDDRASVAVAPDKLTLSKGALKGATPQEDAIAKEKQAKDASTRAAELSKNAGDLNKIAAALAAAAAASAAKVPGVPIAGVPIAGAPIDKPAATVPSVPAGLAVASAAASAAKMPAAPAAASIVGATSSVAALTSTASTATVVAGAPAASAPAATAPVVVAPASSAVAMPAASAPVAIKKPVVVAAPPPEPSLIDELTSNEYVLPGLGLLLAGLAALGFYRYKKREQNASVDSSFLESRLQPDSFFGASGGQRIDTSESASANGSSMVYSPSQLDAAGDVDPVAEADVYLAYGRDLQAEEILKEALRTHPTRVAIHAKLLEIYAKRRDLKGFELIATEAYALTRGTGSEWAYICELGRDLDSANPLYQQGGQPQAATPQSTQQSAAMAASFGGDTIPVPMVSSAPTDAMTDVDFDLDLDFSDGSATLQAPPAVADNTVKLAPRVPVAESALATQLVHEPKLNSLSTDSKDAALAKPGYLMPIDNGMNFDIDLPAADLPAVAVKPIAPVAKAAPTAPAPAASMDSGMMEFDMGFLSLDLDAPVTESSVLTKAAASVSAMGPLETKFALAEEFRALGDSDGARSLASEVVAQAQGTLKTKAQAFLSGLS